MWTAKGRVLELEPVGVQEAGAHGLSLTGGVTGLVGPLLGFWQTTPNNFTELYSDPKKKKKKQIITELPINAWMHEHEGVRWGRATQLRLLRVDAAERGIV